MKQLILSGDVKVVYESSGKLFLMAQTVRGADQVVLIGTAGSIFSM